MIIGAVSMERKRKKVGVKKALKKLTNRRIRDSLEIVGLCIESP
jgi:hypothetical protein